MAQQLAPAEIKARSGADPKLAPSQPSLSTTPNGTDTAAMAVAKAYANASSGAKYGYREIETSLPITR